MVKIAKCVIGLNVLGIIALAATLLSRTGRKDFHEFFELVRYDDPKPPQRHLLDAGIYFAFWPLNLFLTLGNIVKKHKR